VLTRSLLLSGRARTTRARSHLLEVAYHTCLLVVEGHSLSCMPTKKEAVPCHTAAALLPELAVASAALMRYACGVSHGWSAVAAAAGAVPGGEVTRAFLDAVTAALHVQSAAVGRNGAAQQHTRAAMFAGVALDYALRLVLETPVPGGHGAWPPRLRPHTAAHLLSTRLGPCGGPPPGMRTLFRLCLAALSSTAEVPHGLTHAAGGATLLAVVLGSPSRNNLLCAVAQDEELAELAEPCFQLAVDNLRRSCDISMAPPGQPGSAADAVLAATLALRIASLRLCCMLLATPGLGGALLHAILPFLCSPLGVCAASPDSFARLWCGEASVAAPSLLKDDVDKVVFGTTASTPAAEQAALLCALLAGVMHAMQAGDHDGGADALARHVKGLPADGDLGRREALLVANLSCLLSRAAAEAEPHHLVPVYTLLARLQR
jgi:hypothetical protein